MTDDCVTTALSTPLTDLRIHWLEPQCCASPERSPQGRVVVVKR